MSGAAPETETCGLKGGKLPDRRLMVRGRNEAEIIMFQPNQRLPQPKRLIPSPPGAPLTTHNATATIWVCCRPADPPPPLACSACPAARSCVGSGPSASPRPCVPGQSAGRLPTTCQRASQRPAVAVPPARHSPAAPATAQSVTHVTRAGCDGSRH